ncbi:hypothetical protein [Streptococcus parasuis]|uniref:hypothetical protein n=1 Tax=Streptococcus parasuis TaxID=1501662 RepID=UPI00289782CC|nr:hypothetical protein [Streptococcus parasuis]
MEIVRKWLFRISTGDVENLPISHEDDESDILKISIPVSFLWIVMLIIGIIKFGSLSTVVGR